jgi:hypothetical protein
MRTTLLFWSLLLCGCSIHKSITPTYKATIGHGVAHRYEIELPSTYEVQGGNVHMPLDLAKHVSQASYWLYTDALVGEQTPKQFDVCFTRGDGAKKICFLYLKGNITFSGSELLLNIQEPRYRNGQEPPYKWVESTLNGKWELHER